MSPPSLAPDLVDRLARLGVSIGTAGIAAPGRSDAGHGSEGEPGVGPAAGPIVPRPGAPPDAAARSSPAILPIELAVPGQVIENAQGRCYASTVRRAGDELHGGERMAAALEACTASLAALAGRPGLAELDLARTAFVDTETTGLGTGAGTYAFLIGVGRFVDGAFQLRQFFMRHPGEERAQLEAVADMVAGCTGLVTFNGRSFDVPLLTARYTLHRRPMPLAAELHLDLLPPARRLWRRRLPSCALTSLERHILGLDRVDDVPGWLIPERYLIYQRDGDARPLLGIFQHNALDILSMVSLVTRIARAYRDPERALEHAPDWLALARAYEAAGDPGRAIQAYTDALARGLAPADVDEALYRLSLAAKRAGDWERALAVWQDLASAPAPRRLYPFEELAKYWEHSAPERDFVLALDYAQRARGLVAEGSLRPRRGRRVALAELERRVARLARRVGG